MDSIDKRLMQLLQLDARQSSKELSKKLGIGSSTVRYRINRLIKNRQIQIMGIPTSYNIDTLDIIIGVDVAPNKFESVINELTNFSEVLWVMAVTGRYDLFVRVRLADKNDMYDFFINHLNRVDGIRNTETYTCLNMTRGKSVKIYE